MVTRKLRAMVFPGQAQGAIAFGDARVDTSAFDNRNQPERQTSEQRNTESEIKNGRIDHNVADPRESGGREDDEKAQGSAGQSETGDAAQLADNGVSAEQLYGDAPTAGAERGAQCKLTPAAFGAHKQEIGDVGASDEQNHSDAAHKDPKECADVTDNVFVSAAGGSG